MAGTNSVNLLPPQEMTIWRAGFIALFAIALSACGALDYDINEKNFFAPASKQKDMAIIHFHYGDSDQTYDVHVRRVRGGYAMQSALYTDDSGSTNIVASSTKERDYFVGVEGRFSF